MVEIYIGQKSRVAYKEEPEWNSYQAPKDWLGLVQRCDIGDVDELLAIRGLGAAGRNVAMHEPGRMSSSGLIELFLQHGKPLKFGFGKTIDTGTVVVGGGDTTLAAAAVKGATEITVDAVTNFGDVGDTTLVAATLVGATTIEVADATDFAVNDYALIGAAGKEEYRKITAIDGTTFTLNKKLCLAHASGDAVKEVECAQIGAAGEEEVRRVTAVTIGPPATLTLDKGLYYAHDIGDAVTEVTAPYTHKIEEADVVKSMTLAAELYASGGSFVKVYTGVKVDVLTLAGRQGEPLRATLDMIGVFKEHSTTPLAPIPDPTKPYMFQHCQITKGSAVATALSFEYTLANNLDPQHYLATSADRAIQQLPELSRVHHANLEINMFEGANAWLSEFMAGTPFAVEVLFTRAANDTLKLELTDCVFEEFPVDTPIEGRIVQTLPMSARTAKITVVDDIPTY